jgi:hypothetical protein
MQNNKKGGERVLETSLLLAFRPSKESQDDNNLIDFKHEKPRQKRKT